MSKLIVIGGGLAGTEAAWQAAQSGIDVTLYEMRPLVETGAHKTSFLAELVCSNSLGSFLSDRASGLLKEELRLLGSLLVEVAQQNSVPAGNSLSVDRIGFASCVTEKILNHPKIEVIREEITEIPSFPTIIASGPLTSEKLVQKIEILTGQGNMFFYDALAPIVTLESLDIERVFKASRYDRGTSDQGDYINCPLTEMEYDHFVEELASAQQINLHPIDSEIQKGVTAGPSRFFEGCLPIEVLARRGRNALAYGPMRPVGLRDPKTGKRPYAVVQLRQDDLAGTLFNLVGFQTNLTYSEQKRVFQKIPGMENAEFIRYGQMHRNTFISSPVLLDPTMRFKNRVDLFFAGQITGIEGYIGNIASGYLAGVNATRLLNNQDLLEFPITTMLGAISYYTTHTPIDFFQPMKANFGILPALDTYIKNKRDRNQAYANRALNDLRVFIDKKLSNTI